MAYQGINTGTSPNDGLGDTLLEGGIKINSNFSELYNVVGDGTNTYVGVVTQITAGQNISITTSYGSVQISAPTPTNVNTDNLLVTGITTLGTTNGIGTVTIGVGVTALHVDGSARVAGVLTVGNGSITLDNNNINVGSGITISGSNNTIFLGNDITFTASTGNLDASSLSANSATISGHSTSSTLASSGTATFNGDVSLGSSITLKDDKYITLGDGSDFEIVHSSTSGNIIESTSGSLNLRAINHNFVVGTSNTVATSNSDGNYGIEFYYLNDKKLETVSSGVRALGGFQVVSGITTLGVVTGATYFGDGSNLTGIGAGSTARINADVLNVTGISTLGIVTGATYFGDGSNLSGIAGINTTVINTTLFNNTGISTLGGFVIVSSGATVTGVTTFNNGIQIGNNLNIGSNSTQALIQSIASDKLLVRNQIGSLDLWGNTQIRAYKDGGSDFMFRAIADGAFEAYHSGSKKIETTSDGAFVTGILTATSFYGDGSNLTGIGVGATFSGDYNDLTNKPTIPTNNNELTNGAGYITTSFTSYNQLSDTPTIPTNNNELTNGAGYITTSFTNTSQLTNDAGFITTSFTNTSQLTNDAGFITTSFTSYNQLSDTPTIPSNTSDLTNDSGYITNNIVGVFTATSFDGDASSVTSGLWTLGADGSNHYLFTGPGGLSASPDPEIYLTRGLKYQFVNNMNAHPFEIRLSNGGAAYTDGVSVTGTPQNGTTTFEVPFDAPSSLYYQCTSHANMGGVINILDTVSAGVNIVDDTSPQLGGDLDLNSRDITGTGNVNITGVITATSFDGALKGLPQNAQTSAYALVESDAGKHISITTGGISLNSNIFDVGSTVTIYNDSSNTQMITAGPGVTLRRVSIGDLGDRGLNQYGLATIMCIRSNEYVISGAGLT